MCDREEETEETHKSNCLRVKVFGSSSTPFCLKLKLKMLKKFSAINQKRNNFLLIALDFVLGLVEYFSRRRRKKWRLKESPNIASPTEISPNIASFTETSPNIASPNVTRPNVTSPNKASPYITSPYITSFNNASPNATRHIITSYIQIFG